MMGTRLTQEPRRKGTAAKNPIIPTYPEVPDVRVWASGVDFVDAIELDSRDAGEERVRHHRE